MVAPEVVDFRVAITAPFCAPLPVAEVVIVGAAAAVSVGGGGVCVALPPPPHPHNKALNKRPATPIPVPIRIAIFSAQGRSSGARSAATIKSSLSEFVNRR